jgi:hypothetical protein
MLLGIIFYRPIYQVFLDDTDVSKVTQQDVLKTDKPEIKQNPEGGTTDLLYTTSTRITLTNGMSYTEVQTATKYESGAPDTLVKTYKDKKLPAPVFWKFVALIFFQILLVTMVYGPIAAFLVELFPTKIRYTSMSLPYHVGNGVFGGLVPFIATLIASFPGSTPLSGLWYPIGIAALSFLIGAIYLSNKKPDHGEASH